MREVIKQILENEVMSSDQAAKYLDINESGLRARVRRGKLSGVKKGTVWLFDHEDIKSVQTYKKRRG